jgi:transcriptional regulator with XRE-family HTH domain
VGTDLAHISKILSGSRTPSLHLAKHIANALHVTLDELYDFLYPNGREPVRKARSAENKAKE